MEPVKIDKSRKRKPARPSPAATQALARPQRPIAVKPVPQPFSVKLHTAQTSAIRKELETLLKAIDAQAKEIESSLTFESLRTYKEMVRKFVHIIVHELYEVEEKLSVTRTGRKKSMLLIKKIDEELESLSNDFLNNQSNLINFMGRLDDIRGMLLDLYS